MRMYRSFIYFCIGITYLEAKAKMSWAMGWSKDVAWTIESQHNDVDSSSKGAPVELCCVCLCLYVRYAICDMPCSLLKG